MNKRYYPVVILLAAFAVSSSLFLNSLIATGEGGASRGTDAATTLSEERYTRHVDFLAADDMGGRGNGTPGLERAAVYLAAQFKIRGLKPAGDNGTYFQTFELTTGTEIGPGNVVSLGSQNLPTDDLALLKFSTKTEVEGPLVFVGYGITASELHWDDYRDVDVTDKIVIAFRHEPQELDEDSPFDGTEFTTHSSFMNKAINAKQHGARGILFVTDPNNHEPDEEALEATTGRSEKDNSGIAAAYLRMGPVLSYFDGLGRDLRQIQREIDSELESRSFELAGATARIVTDIERIRKPVRNVIASLEGSDPELRNEWVIAGAHYDHLGLGGEFSMERNATGQIHNGADDNASGTAGILELARVASENRGSLDRSVLFMGFSGEELGLLGSNHFVTNPTINLDNAVAMINLDMIGRLDNDRVFVGGIGTSPGFKDLIEGFNDSVGLTLDYSDSGNGSSDHTSFNIKKIPVLFFFSGLHGDYHRPSDTSEKINAEGARRVLQLAYQMIDHTANDPERPEYTQVIESRPISGSGGGYGPYFGSIPDFREVEGVLFADVRAGSPAGKAGFTAGDIMVEFNGKQIQNLYDFTYALRAQKPGDVITVVVDRDGERVSSEVTLEARQ
jgi:hypothetical protein